MYYSAKSSAVATQKLLSGTVTQETQQTQETKETRETQKTAKSSRILAILKKTETAFLKATQDRNNHR